LPATLKDDPAGGIALPAGEVLRGSCFLAFAGLMRESVGTGRMAWREVGDMSSSPVPYAWTQPGAVPAATSWPLLLGYRLLPWVRSLMWTAAMAATLTTSRFLL